MMRKVIAVVTAIVMMAGVAPVALAGSGADRFSVNAYAASTDAQGDVQDDTVGESVADDSRFADVVNGEREEGEPWFRYSDRWFTESSFNLNRRLAAASSYAANTAGRYKKPLKGNASDNDSANGVDAEGMLTGCGFQDIQANQYYFADPRENSMGCVAGHKKLKVGDKEYTLLAVFPYNPKYGQEWVGNLTVGEDSGMHQGFKAGRDEALRFLRGYISEHEIKGETKVWIVGHSRYAAVANLIAGFIVGGGTDYLGDLTVAPEDMYCFTFATPRNLKPEVVKKREALSVAGYRGDDDPDYKNDSAGEEYIYSGKDGGDFVNPHTTIYNGIRNCAPGHDLITHLPPEKWGFDWYGVELPLTDGSPDTKARMLNEMKRFYPRWYDKYVNGCDEDDYRWKTFDFASLTVVDDKTCTEKITQEKMFRQRINDGLARRADNSEEYVDGGYEATLSTFAGLIILGMDDAMSGLQKDMKADIYAAVFSYLDYAAERLEEERGYDEEKAIAVAVGELLELIFGESIDPEDYTVDDFVKQFAKFIVDNADYKTEPVDDPAGGQQSEQSEQAEEYAKQHLVNVTDLTFQSKLAERVFTTISNMLISSIPPEYRQYISWVIPGYDPQDPESEESRNAVGVFVFSMLHQSVYGTEELPGEERAAATRLMLYTMVGMFMQNGQYSAVIDAMKDETGTLNGNADAARFLEEILKLLLGGDLANVGEAADKYVGEVLTNVTTAVLKSGRYEEGSEEYNSLLRYQDVLQAHVTQLRQVLMDILFFARDDDGNVVPFNTAANVRMAVTFISQAENILVAHLMSTYDPWMKAQCTVDAAREDTITRMERMGEVYADQVKDKAALDSVLLSGIKAERKAGSTDATEEIFIDVRDQVDAMIKAKVEADKKAAEEAARAEEEAAAEAAAKEQADTDAANAVMSAIEALPAPDEVTVEHKDAIVSVREVYDILTEDQKAKVSLESLKKLTDVEQALAVAEQAAADEQKRIEEQKRAEEERARQEAEEASRPIAITSVTLDKDSFEYNGEVQKPVITHVIAGDKVLGTGDYNAVFSGGESTDAGTYAVIVTGNGRFIGAAYAEYTISRTANPVAVKGKTVKVKASAAGKKAKAGKTVKVVKTGKTIKRDKALAVTDAVTPLTYQLAGVTKPAFTKYFKVNARTGDITVRKGLKAGTYKLKVSVYASDNDNYKSKIKAVKVTVRVK